MSEEVENLKTALETMGITIPSGSYFISGNTKSDIDFFVYGSKKMHAWLKRDGFRCDLHAVPEAETHGYYRRYVFSSFYSDEYMKTAIKAMFPDLIRRPDLTKFQKIRLNKMCHYLLGQQSAEYPEMLIRGQQCELS